MTHLITDVDNTVIPKDLTESPFTGEGSSGGSVNGEVLLKKGPWTAAEDAILIEYVKKHGEGNWNAVQKHSGLSRCGKSCRLRWANHLRPNLKKGAFTQEEEQLIIELHAKMGNKWARMAAELPGRTDNEIKNYWNTRIKRCQRAGLPLYPPEVSWQVIQDGQQGLNLSGIDGGHKGHHDLVQTSSYEIPDVIFEGLNTKQGILPNAPELPDTAVSSMLMKGFGSSLYGSFFLPATLRPKRLRETMTMSPGYGGNVKTEFPLFDQFQDGTCEKVSQSCGLSFLFGPDPTVRNSESFDENPDSHCLSSPNFSASKPTSEAVKLELPSLQYPETDLGGWGTSSPQPWPESVDSFIQSPLAGIVESNCPSPRNSGLLDALLHESKNLNSGKNHSSDKSSNSSSVTPSDIADSSALNIGGMEWEDYGDTVFPLGLTATSVFNECTSGCSLDEQLPAETFAGCYVKSEPVDEVWTPDSKKGMADQFNFSHPDTFLTSEWFEQTSVYVKEQVTMADAIATFLGNDLCSDCKQMAAEASTSSPGWGLGCCTWNSMPAVCQMTELP